MCGEDHGSEFQGFSGPQSLLEQVPSFYQLLYCASRKIDAFKINAILRKIEGWEKTGERTRHPIYGRQRILGKCEVAGRQM